MITKELKSLIKGVDVVTVTPFTKDLKVDEFGIRKNIRSLLESGIVNGSGILTPLGSTAECFSLAIEERKRVAEIVSEEAYGKVPIFIGCNDTNVDTVIELAKHAGSIKATGIQLMPPYYWCPASKAQIVAFYKKVAQHTNLPILIYNNPGVTSVDLNCDTISTLLEIDNIVALKECSQILVKIEEVIRKFGDKINILSGSSGVEPYASLMGASGFVSGIANVIPKFELGLFKLESEGKFLEAKKYHDQITPFYELARHLNGVEGGGQIVVAFKEGLDMVGLTGNADNVKAPLVPLAEEDKQELKRILENIGAKIIN